MKLALTRIVHSLRCGQSNQETRLGTCLLLTCQSRMTTRLTSRLTMLSVLEMKVIWARFRSIIWGALWPVGQDLTWIQN